MHIAKVPNRNARPSFLLRETYREDGKVKPELRKAPQLVDTLRTPEDALIPPNTLAEIRRDLARLAIVREQIKEIEQARLKHLEDVPQSAPKAMVRLLASVIGLGVETAYLLVLEVFSRDLRDRRAVARYG